MNVTHLKFAHTHLGDPEPQFEKCWCIGWEFRQLEGFALYTKKI